MGVLAFDALAGLMMGVLVSPIGLMSRAVRLRIMRLGKDSKSGRFHNRDDEGIDVRQDISVIGFGAVPFFANAETLKDPVVADVEERHPSAVVIDVGAITNIDTAAADELMKLRAELASRDVMLAFARLSGPARQALLSAGLDMNDRDFGTVEGAVEALANQ